MTSKDILDGVEPDCYRAVGGTIWTTKGSEDDTQLYSRTKVEAMLQQARLDAFSDVLLMLSDQWFKAQHAIERRIIEMAREKHS